MNFGFNLDWPPFVGSVIGILISIMMVAGAMAGAILLVRRLILAWRNWGKQAVLGPFANRVDLLNGEIALIVNTVEEKRSAIHDSYVIRRAALNAQVPTYTTLAGARAAAIGIQGLRELVPYSTQALHRRLQARPAQQQAVPTHAT